MRDEEIQRNIPEVPEPQKGDDTAATPADEAKAETVEKKTESNDLNELKEELAELKKQNSGLYRTMRAERERRQQFQTKVDEITQAINQAKQQQESTSESTKIPEKIPVEFDEEGNAFVPSDKLPKIEATDSDEIKKLKEELNGLKQQTVRTRAKSKAEQELNALLDSKEGYRDAYSNMREQWQFLQDVFDPYIEQHQIQIPKGEAGKEAAINLASETKEIRDKFEKRFPGADIEALMEANLYGSKRHVRKALDKLVTPKASHKDVPKDKPDAVSTTTGVDDGDNSSLISRAASMSTDDFLKLDRKTMDQIFDIIGEASA